MAATDIEAIIERLELALQDVQRVYRANRRAGSPAESTAYDSGRYAGLKEALEIVQAVITRRGET